MSYTPAVGFTPVFTPPINGDFAWVNQGGASVTAADNQVYLAIPGVAGTQMRIRKKAVPAAPYTVTMAWVPMLPGADTQYLGMCLRDSGTGKLVLYKLLSASVWDTKFHVIQASKWTNETTFSADYTIPTGPVYAPLWQVGPCMWFRIQDDNTNRMLQISNDGRHFFTLHSVGRTDFITPNEIGFFGNCDNATHNNGMTVLSWKQE